ncbi:MAG: hypothetical protein VKL59_23170 [Nostocaceae cyanobacterium]|nr:hypothetical protein [Nostocaceae cyanobacterium]
MAFIKIHELRPAGAELFQDSESYLNELNDQELSATFGGEGDETLAVYTLYSESISLYTITVITEVNSKIKIKIKLPKDKDKG